MKRFNVKQFKLQFKMPKAIKSFFVIISGMMLCLCIGFYFSSGLSRSVEKQLKALQENKLQNAYGYTARQFQQKTSYSDFVQFLNANPVLKYNKWFVLSHPTFSYGVGRVKGYAKEQNGEWIPFEFSLTRENNEWKVLGIKVK